jgi:hypothetical protein
MLMSLLYRRNRMMQIDVVSYGGEPVNEEKEADENVGRNQLT